MEIVHINWGVVLLLCTGRERNAVCYARGKRDDAVGLCTMHAAVSEMPVTPEHDVGHMR